MQYQLHLKGYVGGGDFDADYVDYVLSKHSGTPVNVLIDSLGGSLATALSIAAAFQRHGDVSVHFVGMNASAATIASLGAKYITIDASAMYLVHKCSVEFFEWATLNADDFAQRIAQMEQTRSDLEKMDGNIAQMYARKCHKSQADLLALMKAGGWLTAAEAMKWGFVDDVTLEGEDESPVLTDKLVADMTAHGLPVPDMPIQKQTSQFMQFLNTLASFFAQKQATKQNTAMNKKLPKIAAALNQESEAIAFEDGYMHLSEAQALQLEAYLDKQTDEIQQRDFLLDKQAESLTAQEKLIEELKQMPAAATTQVITQGTTDREDDICNTIASALELFNELPD